MPHWAFATVDLWGACRVPGPMGTQRLLPCSGGAGDQPAALMAAFAMIDGMMTA